MGKGNKEGKFPPRVAGMWINTYRDKKARADKKFYKLSVSVKEMAQLIRKAKDDDESYIALVGFKNRNKDKDEHPDVQFQVSEPLKKNSRKSKSRDDDEDEDEEDTDSDDEETEDESDDDDQEDDELPF